MPADAVVAHAPAARSPRLIRLYRRLGARKLVARLGQRAAESIYCRRTELVLRKDLDPALARRVASDTVRVEPITAAHEGLLQQFDATWRTQAKVVASRSYLRHGYRGLLGFLDGEPIGYWWWTGKESASAHPAIERFEIVLDDGDAFAFEYFIAPPYRTRGGAALTFLAAIYGTMATLGYRRVWGWVDGNNVAARWVYKVYGNAVVTRHVSHEILWFLLIQDGRLFIRNTRFHPAQPFDRRFLWSLKRAPSMATRA